VKSSLVFKRPGIYVVNVQGESIIDGISTLLLGNVKLWCVCATLVLRRTILQHDTGFFGVDLFFNCFRCICSILFVVLKLEISY